MNLPSLPRVKKENKTSPDRALKCLQESRMCKIKILWFICNYSPYLCLHSYLYLFVICYTNGILQNRTLVHVRQLLDHKMFHIKNEK